LVALTAPGRARRVAAPPAIALLDLTRVFTSAGKPAAAVDHLSLTVHQGWGVRPAGPERLREDNRAQHDLRADPAPPRVHRDPRPGRPPQPAPDPGPDGRRPAGNSALRGAHGGGEHGVPRRPVRGAPPRAE